MRLIDADAIEYTHEITRSLDDGHNWNELCVTKDEIDGMHTIEPHKWIPISVKLPEKRQDVIVTVNDGMIYTDTDEWIGTGFFAYGHNVVAWQSLPDPWKGEEE